MLGVRSTLCGKPMSTYPGAGGGPKRHNLHRGGLTDDPARLRPHPALFARIGGRAVVARIIDTFYDRIKADPLLGPLFDHSARHNIIARDRQRRFFEAWLGGGDHYTNDEARPLMQGLQRRHYPFPITAQAAGRWLHHMSASLRECGIGPDLVSKIMGRLAPMARRMVNEKAQTPSDSNPMRQRQVRIATAWKFAARGDREGLRPLIARDPGLVTLRSTAGRTLLWEATRRGRRPVVELLAEQGADVNAPGCDQMFHFPYARAGSTLVMITPYCLAMWRGYDDLAAYLSSHGAIIDIYTAAFLGDVPRVTALLDANPELVNAEDPAEDFLPRTPLHHAISGGQHKVADLLLARGADVARHSRWLLTYAAVRNRLDLVQLLLAHGADARESLVLGPLGPGKDQAIADALIAHGFDLHRRPLVFEHSRADTGGGPAVVRALLEYGAAVNARGPDGRAALHYAAQAGNLDLIAVLLAYGADANVGDAAGNTPLIAALRSKAKRRPAAIAALLAGGADPNVRMGSETPLHKVTRDNDRALAKLLLAHGANTAALDTRGRTPLTVATRKGHAALVALLHQHAA